MTSEYFKGFMRSYGWPLAIIGTLVSLSLYGNAPEKTRVESERKAAQVYTIAAGNDRMFSCEEKRQFLDDMGLREKYKILDCGKNVILEYSGGEYVLSVCEFWKDNNIISKKTIDDYIARHTK